MIIEITPLAHGCELVLTNELAAKATEQGWAGILRAAAELLVDEAPTCGTGVAQHAAIPARLATMFSGLAETFELHRTLLVPGDDHVRAFETYVRAQTNVLALLQVAAPRDEKMLASMKPDGSPSGLRARRAREDG